MSNYQQTKWITKNFESLKGLINLPFAIYFLFLGVWNASQAGITSTGKDIGMPLVMIFLSIMVSIWISRYYARRMGTVKTITNSKGFWLFIILFLQSFWLIWFSQSCSFCSLLHLHLVYYPMKLSSIINTASGDTY